MSDRTKNRESDEAGVGAPSGSDDDQWIIDSAVFALQRDFKVSILVVFNAGTNEILALSLHPCLNCAISFAVLFILFREKGRPTQLSLSRFLDPLLAAQLSDSADRLGTPVKATDRTFWKTELFEDLACRLAQSCCDLQRYRVLLALRRTAERWRCTQNRHRRRVLKE